MITGKLEEMINGVLLGDATMECRSQKGTTARLTIRHGVQQEKYIRDLHDELKKLGGDKFILAPLKKGQYWNSKRKRLESCWYFHTASIEELKPFYNAFYKKGEDGKIRKIVPTDIAQRLTPVAFAHWTNGDGDSDRGALRLNTQSFTLSDQKRVIKVLKDKFGITANPNKDRKKYRIRIFKRSMDQVRKLIGEYVHPTLRYKISEYISTRPGSHNPQGRKLSASTRYLFTFIINDHKIRCASLLGFAKGIRVKDPILQKYYFGLVGEKVEKFNRGINHSGKLFLNGEKLLFGFRSLKHDSLIKTARRTQVNQSRSLQRRLRGSGSAHLTGDLGHPESRCDSLSSSQHAQDMMTIRKEKWGK